MCCHIKDVTVINGLLLWKRNLAFWPHVSLPTLTSLGAVRNGEHVSSRWYLKVCSGVSRSSCRSCRSPANSRANWTARAGLAWFRSFRWREQRERAVYTFVGDSGVSHPHGPSWWKNRALRSVWWKNQIICFCRCVRRLRVSAGERWSCGFKFW